MPPGVSGCLSHDPPRWVSVSPWLPGTLEHPWSGLGTGTADSSREKPGLGTLACPALEPDRFHSESYWAQE